MGCLEFVILNTPFYIECKILKQSIKILQQMLGKQEHLHSHEAFLRHR